MKSKLVAIERDLQFRTSELLASRGVPGYNSKTLVLYLIYDRTLGLAKYLDSFSL